MTKIQLTSVFIQITKNRHCIITRQNKSILYSNRVHFHVTKCMWNVRINRSLIGCTFVPRDGSIYCSKCVDRDDHVTDDVIQVKVGVGVASASASNDSLAGAAPRDNNVISREAAITTNHAPPPPAAALFRHRSPDDSSSSYFAGCSQDGASPRQSHVSTKGRAGGRGFLASRGTTSRYLDDDDDSDQSEVYQVKLLPARPRHLSEGSPAGRPGAGSRRRRPLPTPSTGRLEPPEWRTRTGNQRRRAKPRAKTRNRVLAAAAAAQNFEGYASDTPAAHGPPAGGDANVRCSGYSSDSIDPTSVSRRRHVVSTAAQTTGNDVIPETGNGSGGRLMSEAVERYLKAAAAWDERRGCSTCSSSSSDSSSEFDYYLDRPMSASGLGWSSSAIASPLHARKCSSAFKQCVVS